MNFDIVFISFDEDEADYNYKDLLKHYPLAKRVHGVIGIREAHLKAAMEASTDYFYTIDGDNRFITGAKLTVPKELKEDSIYVWRCKNPVNNLVYGYGGIKLWHKSAFQQEMQGFRDHAMTATKKYRIIHDLVTITHFNTSPFNSWKAGFRESVKLMHNIEKKLDKVSEARLDSWLTFQKDQLFGQECITGVKQGIECYKNTVNKDEVFQLINTYDKLSTYYQMLNGSI